MKNRFVKSGLDLEAKMNELDQKVEKKEEFQNELATLDEMLDKIVHLRRPVQKAVFRMQM